jgi:hypothetical protein
MVMLMWMLIIRREMIRVVKVVSVVVVGKMAVVCRCWWLWREELAGHVDQRRRPPACRGRSAAVQRPRWAVMGGRDWRPIGECGRVVGAWGRVHWSGAESGKMRLMRAIKV